jgi:putative zinc finger/helix-turn-helix YgiT family protein
MTDQANTCPDCETGQLGLEVYSDEIIHHGRPLVVEGLECWACDQCGAEIIRRDQIRHADKLIAEAKRKADGLLSGAEIRQIRKSLNLTQHEAATLFGGGANAFSKYERSEVIQSVAMDRLLRLAQWDHNCFDKLQEFAGMQAPEEQASQTTRTRVTYNELQTDSVPFIEDYENVVVGPWQTQRKAA